MNPLSQALEWAISYLNSQKIPILNQKRIVETSYSDVYQIETILETFYLKQVPESLSLEPRMLAFLHDQGFQNIPKLVAQHNTLHCFLMTSAGEISLRHFFKEKIDLTMLKEGITTYTKIQRSLEDKTEQLLKMGVLDWRLSQFASLYDHLIQQEELLVYEGLTAEEIDKLHQLYPTCIALCSDLLAYKIPETINHCDFHDNNMLLDQKTGAINIIDWGEVVLTHPFLSLRGCLWNITYFHKVSQNDLDQLKLQCITPWLDLYDTNDLLHQFNLAEKLGGIFAALGYEQIYRATQDKPNSVQREKRGSIAGCLRSFYNSVE